MTDQDGRKNADKIVGELQKEFTVVGSHRVHPWYAWAIVGIAFGMAIGIVYVSNRNANFNAGNAAYCPTFPPIYEEYALSNLGTDVPFSDYAGTGDSGDFNWGGADDAIQQAVSSLVTQQCATASKVANANVYNREQADSKMCGQFPFCLSQNAPDTGDCTLESVSIKLVVRTDDYEGEVSASEGDWRNALRELKITQSEYGKVTARVRVAVKAVANGGIQCVDNSNVFNAQNEDDEENFLPPAPVMPSPAPEPTI